MRSSDWSSDVCSSDLVGGRGDSLGLNGNKTLADRRLWAFLLGVVAVTIGVLLHLPMFWMGRDMGFRMAGMPMDGAMIAGLWMIVAGIGVAASGLLAKGLSQQIEASSQPAVSATEAAPQSHATWRLTAVRGGAAVIALLKPTTT